MKNIFVALEGGDGAGKTTLTRLLANWLHSLTGTPCRTTFDPGDTGLGNLIRQHLFGENRWANLSLPEQLTLFGAAKVALAREHLLPARQAGEHLISDRFQFGSLVYQGYMSGYPGIQEFVRIFTESLLESYWPDLTLVLDVDPELGLSRKQQAGQNLNFFDNEGLAYRKRIREGYLHYAKHYLPRGVVVINANQPLEAVTAACQQAIFGHFRLA